MNDYSNPKTCDDFGLLLSCALDNELSYQQQELLSNHLVDCESCRDIQKRFESLNRIVRQLGYVSDEPGEIAIATGTHSKNYPSKRLGNKMLPYAVLGASAAVVLLAVSVNFSTGQKTDAGEILKPLVSLSEINSRRIQDQQFFKDSLQFDLRTLKLQLASFEPGNDSEVILTRIERLMERVEKIETINSNNSNSNNLNRSR